MIILMCLPHMKIQRTKLNTWLVKKVKHVDFFSICKVGLKTLKTILYLHSSDGQKDPSCSSISAECVISILLAYMPLNYVKLQAFFILVFLPLVAQIKFMQLLNEK